MRQVSKITVMLCAVLAMGAALRLYGLSAKPLWYDEIGFIAHALKGVGFNLQPVAQYKIPYILILKAWIAAFGIGAFATRLLSVLFGIASILLVYRLGKKLFGTGVALIASFLLSISCFHIYHSQQVKHYSVLTFLVILSSLFFIDFLERKRTGILIGNLLLNILIVCTHPFGLSAIIVQFFYVFSVRRSLEAGQLQKWLRFQLILVPFLGIWIGVLFASRGHFEMLLWWARLPTLQSLIETFSTFSYGGPQYGLSSLEPTSFPPVITGAMVMVFSVFFVRGIFLILRRPMKGHRAFAVALLAVPVALGFLFSYLFFPVYLIKNYLIFLPAFCLIVATGMHYRRWLFSLAVLVAVFLLNIIPLKIMYGADINVNWHKAVDFVKSNGLHDDDVIIIATTKEVVSFMYYFGDARKSALQDMLIFGRFDNGRWQDAFWHKGHFIITLGSERNRQTAQYRDPGPGMNMMYSLDYIVSDLDKKALQYKDIIQSHRQIWLLMSPWAGDAYGDRAFIDKLASFFLISLEKKRGGIAIYRLRPSYNNARLF